MKKIDFSGMSPAAMEQKITELRLELIKLNAQVAKHTQIKNAGQIRRIKRTIAIAKTFINNKKEAKKKE
jgi:ribosomal protein L29